MADAEAELRKKIIAIQRNPDLTPQEKARKCQDLMTFGGAGKAPAGVQHVCIISQILQYQHSKAV